MNNTYQQRPAQNTNQARRVVNGVPVVNVHGNNYVEVATRVNAVHNSNKDFEVVSSEFMNVGERVLCQVRVLVDGKQFVGTAEVKLNAAKGTPDGSNPFECAETSALGRALAFAGFGSVERIASYEEIARNQPGTIKAS